MVRVGCEYPASPASDGGTLGGQAVVTLAEREQVCWAALLRNQRDLVSSRCATCTVGGRTNVEQSQVTRLQRRLWIMSASWD